VSHLGVEDGGKESAMEKYQVVFDALHHTFLVRRRIFGLFWKSVFRSDIYFCALAFKRELERPRWAA